MTSLFFMAASNLIVQSRIEARERLAGRRNLPAGRIVNSKPPSWLFLPLAEAPGLDELPVDVNGVVDVEDEAFAAVEEAEAEKVVVDEGRRRVQDRVPEECERRAAGFAALVQ